MTVHDILGYVFWIVPTAVLLCTARLMLARRLHAVMPWYFAYVCANLLFDCLAVLPLVDDSKKAYFLVFWMGRLADFAFGLGAIHEVFAAVLEDYAGLRRLGTLVFRGIVAVLLIACVLTAVASPGSDTDRVMAGLFVLERSVRMVQVGLLLGLFVFSSVFGISWRNRIFGVALGLAIFTSVQLAMIAMRASMGSEARVWFRALIGLGETGGLVVTLAYLHIPERERKWGVLETSDLQQWSEALAGLLNR